MKKKQQHFIQHVHVRNDKHLQTNVYFIMMPTNKLEEFNKNSEEKHEKGKIVQSSESRIAYVI